MDRLPWVSLSLAALCVLAFLVTWVAPAHPMGFDEERMQEIGELWGEHPELVLPPLVRERLPEDVQRRVDQLHEEAVRERRVEPDAQLQGQLDALADAVRHDEERSLMRRLALVPARGAGQWGWLFHMFLHFGWMHLLGNLFFFYLTGPMLEDVWGRPLFAAFYVAGGLVAGLAHAGLDPASQVPMAGASGAVAACIGAFTWRFARKRVRMGYFIWLTLRPLRGTFPMPAWAAGLVWFGLEVLSYALGASGGVAVMAHIGGFLFGLAVASTLALSGVEERFVTPAVVRRSGSIIRPQSLDRAVEALARGDLAQARRAVARALAAYPDNAEAQLLLYQLDRREQRPGAGVRLASTLEKLLAQGLPDALTAAVLQLGPELDPAALPPPLALRLAQALEAVPGTDVALVEALFTRAARAPGASGAEALVRQAERALAERRHAAAAQHLEALAGHAAVRPALAERAQAVRAELAERAQWASGLELATEPAAPAPAPVAAPARAAAPAAVRASTTAGPLPPRFVRASVVSETAAGLLLRAAGGVERPLAYAQLVAVGAGLTPHPSGGDAPPRLLPVTDLVLRWGQGAEGPLVLRLGLAELGLAQRHPGVPLKDAYGRWLHHLVHTCALPALPDRAALLGGQYPRFPDAAAMDRAFYG